MIKPQKYFKLGFVLLSIGNRIDLFGFDSILKYDKTQFEPKNLNLNIYTKKITYQEKQEKI